MPQRRRFKQTLSAMLCMPVVSVHRIAHEAVTNDHRTIRIRKAPGRANSPDVRDTGGG
jgi:hypothetical protein